MIGNYYYGTGRRKSAVARVFLKKGTGRLACNGSIPGLPGGRRTARSGCSWRMSPGMGTR